MLIQAKNSLFQATTLTSSVELLTYNVDTLAHINFVGQESASLTKSIPNNHLNWPRDMGEFNGIWQCGALVVVAFPCHCKKYQLQAFFPILPWGKAPAVAVLPHGKAVTAAGS